MRKRIYFGKFDKWISEKIEGDGWNSVAFDVIWLVLSYPIMYYLPQIAFYVNGSTISPEHHYGWTMKWYGFLCLVLIFFLVLKIIRLLRKRA